MLQNTGIDNHYASALASFQAQADAAEIEFERWLTSVSAETEEILRIFEDSGLDIYSAFRVARENGRL